MPEAQHYLVMALGVTFAVAGAMILALRQRWRRVGKLERVLAVAACVVSISVIGYWLLLYKSIPSSGGRALWIAAWAIAIGGMLWLVMSAGLEATVPRTVHHERRRLIANVAAASVGVVVTRSVATYDPADVQIERHQAVLPSLPQAADGMTLAILSDLHAGPFIEPRHVEYYATVIEQNKPDAIVLPGDFITARAEDLRPYYKALSRLRAPCGVAAVLGNHDYFNGGAPDVVHMLRQCGIAVLSDEWTWLGPLQVFGLSDARRLDVELHSRHQVRLPLFEQLAESEQPIVLVHRPFVFDALATINPRVLTIAGHTHGGQICVPLAGENVLAVNRLLSPYVRGWYRRGLAQLYVTRGVGTVGIPVRVGAPPEITFITLRRPHA